MVDRYQEYSFPRLFVPWNIRSHDGTFVLGTIRSLEHSFPGPFVPWNFRSQDYSFPGTFVPWTVRSLDRSFHGTFVPGTLDLSCRGPFVDLSAEHVPGLEQRNKQKRDDSDGAQPLYTNSQESGNDFLIARAGSSPPLLLLLSSSLPFPLPLPFPSPPFPLPHSPE